MTISVWKGISLSESYRVGRDWQFVNIGRKSAVISSHLTIYQLFLLEVQKISISKLKPDSQSRFCVLCSWINGRLVVSGNDQLTLIHFVSLVKSFTGLPHNFDVPRPNLTSDPYLIQMDATKTMKLFFNFHYLSLVFCKRIKVLGQLAHATPVEIRKLQRTKPFSWVMNREHR